MLEGEEKTNQSPDDHKVAEARPTYEIPWRKFVAKPKEIEAIQVGTDVPASSFNEDLSIGDYLIRNPYEGEDEPDAILCPKEIFEQDYSEVQ